MQTQIYRICNIGELWNPINTLLQWKCWRGKCRASDSKFEQCFLSFSYTMLAPSQSAYFVRVFEQMMACVSSLSHASNLPLSIYPNCIRTRAHWYTGPFVIHHAPDIRPNSSVHAYWIHWLGREYYIRHFLYFQFQFADISRVSLFKDPKYSRLCRHALSFFARCLCVWFLP